MLEQVRAAVEDWQPMRERMQALLDEPMPAGMDTDEFAEARALLAWVADHHFTYLGYREYELTEDALHAVEGSGLGLLRGGGAQSTGFAKLPVAVRALAREPDPLVLAKATTRSPVHRPAYLDYIGVKKFDDEGNVVGERRFLGLYTTGAYREVPANIPVLRQKAQAVRERAGFVPGSHDDKALIEVIDTFPRDELFQIGVEDLYEIAVGILELGERQRVRLFMRTDRYERFVSCLVFIPRDRFNTANRIKIGEILSEALGAESLDWGLRLTEWVLVRIHYTLHLPADVRPDFDASELEARIVEAVRSWDDDLLEALLEETGEERGMALYRQYGAALPARLPGRAARPLGRRRRAADRGPDGRGRAGPLALPSARGAARRAALQGLPARRTRVAERRAPDVRVARADRDRRAPLPRDAARGPAGVAVRLRAARPGPGRRRRHPRPLPRGLRARVAGRRRAGRLQRPHPRRRPRLARGDDAARRRALPAPGRASRSATATWSPRCSPTRASRARSSSCSARASTRRARGAARTGWRSRSSRPSTPSTRSTRTGSCAAS